MRGKIIPKRSKWVATALLPVTTKHRVPTMYDGSNYPEARGLDAYSTNGLESYRRAGVFVDKILKGTEPTEGVGAGGSGDPLTHRQQAIVGAIHS